MIKEKIERKRNIKLYSSLQKREVIIKLNLILKTYIKSVLLYNTYNNINKSSKIININST